MVGHLGVELKCELHTLAFQRQHPLGKSHWPRDTMTQPVDVSQLLLLAYPSAWAVSL